MIAILVLHPSSNLDTLNQLLPSLKSEPLLLRQGAFFGSRGRLPISLSRGKVSEVSHGLVLPAHLHQGFFLVRRNNNSGNRWNGPLLLEFESGLEVQK
jgi:hypothetical protein